MAKIKISGSWLSKENEIKEGVARAFQNLLTESGDWRPSLEGLEFERIGVEDVGGLEEAFNEEEVFSALFELN